MFNSFLVFNDIPKRGFVTSRILVSERHYCHAYCDPSGPGIDYERQHIKLEVYISRKAGTSKYGRKRAGI